MDKEQENNLRSAVEKAVGSGGVIAINLASNMFETAFDNEKNKTGAKWMDRDHVKKILESVKIIIEKS